MSRLDDLRAMIAEPGDDCILWPFATSSKGYAYVQVDGRTCRAHVVTCTWVHGPRPADAHAAHSCGTRHCVNPRHLRWATPVENARDKVDHGRVGRTPKLDERDVVMIRRLAAKGVTQRYLADVFGVTSPCISQIVRGVTWRHLPLAAPAA